MDIQGSMEGSSMKKITKKEIEYIKNGIRSFNSEMDRIAKEIELTKARHRERFEKAQKSIRRGIRMTNGNL